MNSKNYFIPFIYLYIYCFLLKYMFSICFPFILAIITYFLIKPLIDIIERYLDLHRSAIGVSILLIIYLLIALLLGFLITYFVLFLFQQSHQFSAYLQQYTIPYFQSLISYIQKHYSFLMNQDIVTMIQDFIGQSLLLAMDYLSTLLSHIPSFLFSFFLFIISTFFLTLEYDDIKDKIISFTSPKCLQGLIFIKNQSFQSLKVYLKCQVIFFILCFLLLFVSFSILKINHASFYALFISFLDSLPFIGIGLVLLPMCILMICQKYYLKALYLFLIYLMMNVIRSLLEPRIMKKELKIPSFIFLLSMIIHLHFFGIIGIVLSPIHLNLIYSLYHFHESISFVSKN